MAPTTQLKTQKLKIADLKPHPKQKVYFAGDTDTGLEELAADIERNGLKEAIQVAADGVTTISGHRRVAAHRKLRRETIDAYIRTDLKDEAAIEAVFLQENALRRQLSDLQQVRCAKRKVELAKHTAAVSLPQPNARRKTRDIIGKHLGISGRQADRLLRVTECPIEVQRAYEARKVSLVLAGKVAGLPQDVQAEIAEQIKTEGIDSTKQIIQRHLNEQADTRPKRMSPTFANNAARDFIVGVAKAVRNLDGQLQTIAPLDQDDVEYLKAGRKLIDNLIAVQRG